MQKKQLANFNKCLKIIPNNFIIVSISNKSIMQAYKQYCKSIKITGDSGYPQWPWLLTPILNAVENSREHIYMQRHMLRAALSKMEMFVNTGYFITILILQVIS